MDALDTVRLTAVVTRDGQWCVARTLEAELASQGETIEEALANLREAAELYFEDEAVPEPVAPIVASLDTRLRTA
jgi:predicted RNase H-like HicB family nuclease